MFSPLALFFTFLHPSVNQDNKPSQVWLKTNLEVFRIGVSVSVFSLGAFTAGKGKTQFRIFFQFNSDRSIQFS